jgi:hypothetical protein
MKAHHLEDTLRRLKLFGMLALPLTSRDRIRVLSDLI